MSVNRMSLSQSATRFPIVGLGASAGGLRALEAFFAEVSPDSGMAFVVVTHQLAGHPSLLPELLARRARIPVLMAANHMPVVPNRVYVSPPASRISLRNEHL